MPVTRMRLPSRMPTAAHVTTTPRHARLWRVMEIEDEEAALEELAAGDIRPSNAVRIARVLGHSARTAGAGAVASGRWLANTVFDVAPRIPIRSRDVLIAQHGGLTGMSLAQELVRRAARTSAAV